MNPVLRGRKKERKSGGGVKTDGKNVFRYVIIQMELFEINLINLHRILRWRYDLIVQIISSAKAFYIFGKIQPNLNPPRQSEWLLDGLVRAQEYGD